MKILLLISIIFYSVVNIAVTVQVDQRVFNKIADAAKNKLITEIKNAIIENYDCKPGMGKCSAHQFKIIEFEIKKLSVIFFDSHICFSSDINKGLISVFLDYKSTLVNSKGGFFINLVTDTLRACFSFTKSVTGVYGVKALAQANVSQMDLVYVTGNSLISVLGEVAFKVMKVQIIIKINKLLATKMKNFLESTVETMMNRSPAQFEFDKVNHIMVDYSPIGIPQFSPHGLIYYSSSHFFPNKKFLLGKKKNKSPFKESKYPMLSLGNEDVIISFSDYMINEFLWCYFENTDKFLYKYEYTDDDNDRKILSELKTITNIFDGIEVNQSLAFKISFQAKETPVVKIAPILENAKGGITGTMFVRVIIELIKGSKFPLSVELELKVAIRFTTKLAESNKSIELKLQAGEIVEFTVKPKMLPFLNTNTIVPFLNSLLKNYVVNSKYEFEIPVSSFPNEVKISDAKLTMHNKFMRFAANLEFLEFQRILI